MAERFVAEGARVAVVDWNGDAATQTAARLGAGSIAIRADVTAAADVGRRHTITRT
jgi:NAD(P)-dependent dehydrogenase (short-subunit alcohol dehydrogenase family)